METTYLTFFFKKIFAESLLNYTYTLKKWEKLRKSEVLKSWTQKLKSKRLVYKPYPNTQEIFTCSQEIEIDKLDTKC